MEKFGAAVDAPGGVFIRDADPGDVERIVCLHSAVWRETYQTLAPPAVIATLTSAERLMRWRAMLNAPAPGQVTLVAEGDGTLAGFGQLGSASHELFGDRLEIKFLYVSAAHRGRGVGRRLMASLAKAAIDQSATGLALGVVNGNDRAIEFYERIGGQRIGQYTDPGPVWRSDNFVYAWDDLDALASGRR